MDLKLEKFPSLKTLSGKISELTDKQNELQKSLTTTREKAKMLNITTHNARMVLGYCELETQNIDPVEIPTLPQDLWVYTSSFVQAFNDKMAIAKEKSAMQKPMLQSPTNQPSPHKTMPVIEAPPPPKKKNRGMGR